MEIKVPGKSCSKCGIEDIAFYARKKRGKISISSSCILCHREDEGFRNRRLFKEKKSEYARRNKQWRAKNREEYNESQRDWYAKNAERINAKKRDQYIPKFRKKGFRGKRVAQPNNPFRNFNFRNERIKKDEDQHFRLGSKTAVFPGIPLELAIDERAL